MNALVSSIQPYKAPQQLRFRSKVDCNLISYLNQGIIPAKCSKRCRLYIYIYMNDVHPHPLSHGSFRYNYCSFLTSQLLFILHFFLILLRSLVYFTHQSGKIYQRLKNSSFTDPCFSLAHGNFKHNYLSDFIGSSKFPE